MFFVAIYNIAKMLIKVERYKKELSMIKIARSKELGLIVKHKDKVSKYWGNGLTRREKEINKLLKNKTINKEYLKIINSRLINHVGHSIFGEDWYYYKFGLIENFFWNHPILDVLFHSNDNERWKFLGQWLTIYRLPPFIRVGIRTFLFKTKQVRNFDFFFKSWEKKEGSLENKNFKREVVKRTKQLSYGMVKYLLDKNNNPDTISDRNKGIIRLIKTTDKTTQEFIIFKLNLLLLSHKGIKDIKQIAYRDLLTQWGEPVYIIRFIPNSPETGNFYLCELNLINKTIEVWINNVWYRDHSNSYKWKYGYWLMYRCLTTRNFGKLYNKYFKHYSVPRPKRTHKNYNFNGTKA